MAKPLQYIYINLTYMVPSPSGALPVLVSMMETSYLSNTPAAPSNQVTSRVVVVLDDIEIWPGAGGTGVQINTHSLSRTV